LRIRKRRRKKEKDAREIGKRGRDRTRDGELTYRRSDGGSPATGEPADEAVSGVAVAEEEGGDVAGGGGDESCDGGDEGGRGRRGGVVGERGGDKRESAEQKAFDVAWRGGEAVDDGG